MEPISSETDAAEQPLYLIIHDHRPSILALSHHSIFRRPVWRSARSTAGRRHPWEARLSRPARGSGPVPAHSADDFVLSCWLVTIALAGSDSVIVPCFGGMKSMT
jgi:hypothetical protein